MRVSRRIADIEVLRAIAVVFVIVCHMRDRLFPWKIERWDHVVQNYFNFWTGVDLFFAISGFVIARSLLPKLRDARDPMAFAREILVFWIRRIWRLLPSAWLWLGIILACSVWFNRSLVFYDFHRNFEATIAGMLSLANVRLGTNMTQYVLVASSHYWSLSLEEQFYLLLPLLALLLRRRLARALLVMTIVVFVLPQSTLLMAFRVHAVLLGVLLAIFSEQPAYALFEPVFMRDRPLAAAAVLIAILTAIAALAVFGQTIVSFNVDIIAILCAILVLFASYDRNYFCRNATLRLAMLWIADRSYGLYLIHVPAFLMAREIWFRRAPPGSVPGPQNMLELALTGGALMLVLTELNYRLVERPLRRYGVAAAGRLMAGPPAPAAEPVPAPAAIRLDGELTAES